MAGRNQYKARQFIDAMPGSGGVVSVIAQRVGCDWHTAKKYIGDYATVKQAYEDEIEHNVDLAESVVIQNIKYALKEQQDKKQQVDSGDAKWYLSRKGKGRGYAERREITGAEGEAVELAIVDRLKRVVEMSEDEFTNFAGTLPDLGPHGTLEKIAEVEG